MQTAVCILYPVPISYPVTYFYTQLQSAVCILYLVCFLYPVCSLQSAVCSLHFVLTELNIQNEYRKISSLNQRVLARCNVCHAKFVWGGGVRDSFKIKHKTSGHEYRLIEASVFVVVVVVVVVVFFQTGTAVP